MRRYYRAARLKRQSLRLGHVLLGVLATLGAEAALAQTPPGAGELLREQPKPPAVTPAKPLPIVPAVPAPAASEAGPRIKVSGFRLTGATLIPEAELQQVLAPLIGKEYTLGQLRDIANMLTVYYAEKGWLAKVVVPPQDIKDGQVLLRIVEGVRGELKLDTQGARLDAERIRRMIDRRVAAGQPLNLATLGEIINILNEQPGVAMQSSLRPGAAEAAVDLAVAAQETPLAAFNLGANNQGSRATGELQASGGVAFNNLLGAFDSLALAVNAADGSTYGRVDYGLAVGDDGLRLGINASDLRYHLTQASYSALHAHGTATTLGLSAQYPWVRRQDLSLSLVATYDDKHLQDLTIAGETSRKRIEEFSLGLLGSAPDARWGGGVSRFGLTLHTGNAHQLNAGALTTDQTTRRMDGAFARLEWQLGRQQWLDDSWSLDAGLRGQWADKNLDATQRFSLGGPTGVRAYPNGEALGDEGWLLNLNLGRSLGDTLIGRIFLDAGGITLNHTVYAGWNSGNANLPNRYQLAGAGIGVDWRVTKTALFTASLAVPLGSNPGRDAQGNDSDNRHERARAWLSLNAYF